MAQTALKLDTGFDSTVTNYEAKTRQDALYSVLSGDATTASHEHVVNPLVHNAVGHIIKNKPTLNIELYGFPYEVLEQASAQLEQAGISSQLASQAMAALEEYILNMGTDFSRAAKAKPLYARFQVTDKEPEGLPECEQSQATFLDGMRSYGGDSAKMIRYMSIFGPKSTSSQGVDVDKMFASKNMGLFIFFGSPGNEGVKGFDGMDNALMNAAQGVGGAGGALSEEAMAEIIEMIQNGDMSAEALALLESLAELSQLQEAMQTPDAVENAQEKLTDLVNDISDQIAQGIESGAIPSTVISAAVNKLIIVTQNPEFSNVLEGTAIEGLVSDNDNLEGIEDTQTLSEKLENLDELSTEELHELIEILSEMDGLPLEVEALLEQINIEGVTPQELAELLSMESDSALSLVVQDLVVALNTPEIQTLLPQEALTQVNQFLTNHSDLVDAVTTNVVVQTLESASEGIPAQSAERIEVQNIIDDLTSGAETLSSIDTVAIEAIAIESNIAVFKALDKAVSTITATQADNVVLNQATILTLNEAAQASNVESGVKEILVTAIQSQDVNAITNIMTDNPQINSVIPQRVQDIVQASQTQQTVKPNSMPEVKEAGVNSSLASKDRGTTGQAEAKGVSSANDNISEQEKPTGNTQNTNETDVEQRQDYDHPVDDSPIDINEAPEQIKFESPCATCPGGVCPGCGPDFNDAIQNALNEDTGYIPPEYKPDEIKYDNPVDRSNVPNNEDSKFESPCESCPGGVCPGCGPDFDDAIQNALSEDSGLFAIENNDPDGINTNTASVEKKSYTGLGAGLR